MMDAQQFSGGVWAIAVAPGGVVRLQALVLNLAGQHCQFIGNRCHFPSALVARHT
jgi:hypothetical protein